MTPNDSNIKDKKLDTPCATTGSDGGRSNDGLRSLLAATEIKTQQVDREEHAKAQTASTNVKREGEDDEDSKDSKEDDSTAAAEGDATRPIPAYKKPDSALTFPEKVRARVLESFTVSVMYVSYFTCS